SDQAYPPTHGVNDDRPGKIMEGRAKSRLKPTLNAEITVPCNALKEWIEEAYQQERSGQLRIEFRAFGDAARYDCGNGGCEGQQKKELHELISAFRREIFRTRKEVHPIGD